MPFLEFWIGVEQVHLAGGTFHEQEDDTLGFAGELGRAGSHGVDGGTVAVLIEQVLESGEAEAAAERLEELSPVGHVDLFQGGLFPRDEFVEVQQDAGHQRGVVFGDEALEARTFGGGGEALEGELEGLVDGFGALAEALGGFEEDWIVKEV